MAQNCSPIRNSDILHNYLKNFFFSHLIFNDMSKCFHKITMNFPKSTANLVLHRTIERIHVGKKYGDIPRGIFIVRGENVVLLGEVVS